MEAIPHLICFLKKQRSPGCLRTLFVDQAHLELKDLPAAAGIKGVHH